MEPLLHDGGDAEPLYKHLAGWREKAEIAIILECLSSDQLSCWEVVCRFGEPLGKAMVDEGPLAEPLAKERSKVAKEIVADLSNVIATIRAPSDAEGPRRMPTELANKCDRYRHALENEFGVHVLKEMDAESSLLFYVAGLQQMELLLDCRALADAAVCEASNPIICWQKLAEVDDKAACVFYRIV